MALRIPFCPRLTGPRCHARRRELALLIGAALVLLQPPAALAYDFEVTSRTEAHVYQLRRYDLDGLAFMNRRRIAQWLGLRIFNLLDPGQQAFSPRGGRPPALLTVHATMRIDADFGNYAAREAKVSEVSRSDLDLLLAGLEGKALFGWLDFELGRQVDTELMDFFAFDGLRLRANLPGGFFVEAHGGVQVAGAHPFSSAVFETEGTPGDPAREAWSPSYGIAAGIDGGPAGLQLRLAYRGLTSRTAPVPLIQAGPEAASVWGVDQELLFFGAGFEVPRLRLRPRVGVRYDLLTAQLDDIEVAASLPLGARLQVQLEYLRSRPHFDGDSILNLFSLEPTSDLAGRLSLQVMPELMIGVRAGHRWFWAPPEEGRTREPGVTTAGLVTSWSSPRLRTELEAYYQGGDQGVSAGADLDGAWLLRRWLSLEGRLSLLRFRDLQRQDQALWSFGVQAGARVTFTRGVLVHLLVEDNVSRLYRSALRVLGVLDLEFAP